MITSAARKQTAARVIQSGPARAAGKGSGSNRTWSLKCVCTDRWNEMHRGASAPALLATLTAQLNRAWSAS
jgi:hypothetical protein